MKLDIEFRFTEQKRIDFGVVDEVSVKILGQEFRELYQVDKRFADKIGKPEWDRERARLFGMKLQEIGLGIQRQAEKGKPDRWIYMEGTSNEREIVSF